MDKKFKHWLVEFDTPQIYCDMDGVLADFDKGIKNIIGGKFDDKGGMNYQMIFSYN